MENIFKALLGMSLSGSVMILLVLVLRLLLKNAPKRLVCLLWLLVGIRLLLPVHIEAKFSLQPDFEQVLAQPKIQQEFIPEDVVPAVPNPGENIVLSTGDAVTIEVQRSINWVSVVAVVWILGAAVMLLYTAVSYIGLNRQVRGAVQTEDGVWESRNVDGAFLFGYFKPRIFLPAGLTGCDREYVLSHERTHIACGDHWAKLIGFLCLSLHWFNPLVWIAYRLLCQDLEMACDEQVVRRYSLEERKAYSNALLSCSVGSRPVSACPIAFGEVDVKERIMKILNYRKPKIWICLICVLAVIGTAVFFLTNSAPKYGTVFEEYGSMVGLQRTEFLDKLNVDEDDVVYEFRMHRLPETVEFNGSQFQIIFQAEETTMDRVGSMIFRNAQYNSIENLAEDLVAIEKALFNVYGPTRYEMPICRDVQQVLDDYATKNPANATWNMGVSWEMEDTAPYSATQEFMDDMPTWEHVQEIAVKRWGADVVPRSIYIIQISAGDDGTGNLWIQVSYSVALSRKDSWG